MPAPGSHNLARELNVGSREPKFSSGDHASQRNHEVVFGLSGVLEAWYQGQKTTHLRETSGLLALPPKAKNNYVLKNVWLLRHGTPGLQKKHLAKQNLGISLSQDLAGCLDDRVGLRGGLGYCGIIFVDLCSTFQAGAVGHAPRPNFGRKPALNR